MYSTAWFALRPVDERIDVEEFVIKKTGRFKTGPCRGKVRTSDQDIDVAGIADGVLVNPGDPLGDGVATDHRVRNSSRIPRAGGPAQSLFDLFRRHERPFPTAGADRCFCHDKRCEKANGPDDPWLAAHLNNLAELCRGLARYEEAEPLYLRALSILQRAPGPEHPMIVSLVHNLAALRQDQGRYDEAEALLRRSLAQREQVSGPGHPNTASTLNNLAVLLMKQARYAEAEPLCNQALAAWESSLGPCSLQTARGVGNLAGLLSARGRYRVAEPLFRRALAGCVSRSGSGLSSPLEEKVRQ